MTHPNVTIVIFLILRYQVQQLYKIMFKRISCALNILEEKLFNLHLGMKMTSVLRFVLAELFQVLRYQKGVNYHIPPSTKRHKLNEWLPL